jgi:hypothetical protein
MRRCAQRTPWIGGGIMRRNTTNEPRKPGVDHEGDQTEPSANLNTPVVKGDILVMEGATTPRRAEI